MYNFLNLKNKLLTQYVPHEFRTSLYGIREHISLIKKYLATYIQGVKTQSPKFATWHWVGK